MAAKHIVYILRSVSNPERPYIGLTHDVDARLEAHNSGRCAHTSKYRPWSVVVEIRVADEPTAIRLERYLKSGSGRAFSKRHLEPFQHGDQAEPGDDASCPVGADLVSNWS